MSRLKAAPVPKGMKASSRPVAPGSPRLAAANANLRVLDTNQRHRTKRDARHSKAMTDERRLKSRVPIRAGITWQYRVSHFSNSVGRSGRA